MDANEKADRICKSEGLTFALAVNSGGERDMREARKYLQAAIAKAIQEAFDLGFKASGGTVIPLTRG